MTDRFVTTLLEVKAAVEAGKTCVDTEPSSDIKDDPAKQTVESKLRLLKELYEKGLISEEQYKEKSTELLSEI